jgi:N4-gp56 family major capsid protein
MSDSGYYWNSNTFTKSDVSKNPWSDSDSPFVLFISPEQWETLMKDSQFSNAMEYGGREAVLQGQIAQFAGIKIVVTEKVPSFKDGQSYKVTGTETDADVNGHICVLCKARVGATIAWGRKAEFKIFDWPVADQVRIKMSLAYGVEVVHPDSIVRIIVSDE